MPLTGNLDETGLDEILQLLAGRQRSGVLTVIRRDAVGRLVMRQGRVMFASLDSVSRFGNLLVERGVLSRDELDVALTIQSGVTPRKPLATVLLEQRFVTREVLEAAVREHIVRIFSQILDWDSGLFHFEVTRLDEKPLVAGDGMSVQFLLLEGARFRDELRTAKAPAHA